MKSRNAKDQKNYSLQEFEYHNFSFIFQNLPIWVSGENAKTGPMSVIELQKSYGLDDVFRRIQAENILLQYDFYRLRSILHEAFANQQVDESQKVYLKRKYKTIKRTHMNSFTELFMNNLLHLVNNLKEMSGIQFLPDLQKVDESCTKQDLGKNFCTIGHLERRIFAP